MIRFVQALRLLMKMTKKFGDNNESAMNYKREIKISSDFENDPQGAIDALEKTGFAIFMITKKWFDDPRAQKEWRFARDMKKPMVYVFDKTKKYPVENKFLFDVPSLIGTINHYGNTKKTGHYLEAFIQAFIHDMDKK